MYGQKVLKFYFIFMFTLKKGALTVLCRLIQPRGKIKDGEEKGVNPWSDVPVQEELLRVTVGGLR